MFGTLLARVRALLALPANTSRSFKAVEEVVRRLDKRAEKARQADDKTNLALSQLREDVDDRFQRINLQLERIAALSDPRRVRPTTRKQLPLKLESSRSPSPSLPSPALEPDSGSEWISVATCGACGSAERTVVCAWNKLALLENVPDERAWRYDFAVCHGCGLLYATERPVGRRYQYLVENFEDVVGKKGTNPLLYSGPLTDEDREEYRRLIAAGVFVSDHTPIPYLKGVLTDRMDNAHHVDLLGSLLDLRGKRVLEIRSRAGTISEGLRRLHGADVHAIPMFESQQFVLREMYGIQTGPIVDFESFTVPFDGRFDLILANHAFNHAVHLDAFLATIRESVNDGGYLYLYNEIDDREFLDGTQSMIATMNPLHMQACDSRSLVRALAARGFEPVFLRVRQRRQLYLVRRNDAAAFTPIPGDELRRRIDRYERARDRAVLKVPPDCRPRFASEWPSTLERAVRNGIAVVDGNGSVRLTK